MGDAAAALAARLHAFCAGQPHHVAILLVGGAALAPGVLLGQPGGSAWLREIKIPYAKESLAEALKPFDPNANGFCSVPTAMAMADSAYRRALAIGMAADHSAKLSKSRVVGLGLTASLASSREKRGQHRVHVAVQCSQGTARVATAVLSGSRQEEEEQSCHLLLHALASVILPDGPVLESSVPWPNPPLPLIVADFSAIRTFRASFIMRLVDGRLMCQPPFEGIIYPGSFNPLHKGHQALADLVSARFPGLELAYEISMVNADKPMLSDEELTARCAAFQNPVFITRAPLFVDKARLFPRCIFVLGADTVVRLLDPKYYAPGELMGIMSEMVWGLGIRFVVSGRLDSKSGLFTNAREQAARVLPPSFLEKAFIFLSEEDFRVDLSSTELRAKRLESNNL